MNVDPVRLAASTEADPWGAHAGQAFRAFLITMAQFLADVSSFAEGCE